MGDAKTPAMASVAVKHIRQMWQLVELRRGLDGTCPDMLAVRPNGKEFSTLISPACVKAREGGLAHTRALSWMQRKRDGTLFCEE